MPPVRRLATFCFGLFERGLPGAQPQPGTAVAAWRLRLTSGISVVRVVSALAVISAVPAMHRSGRHFHGSIQ